MIGNVTAMPIGAKIVSTYVELVSAAHVFGLLRQGGSSVATYQIASAVFHHGVFEMLKPKGYIDMATLKQR